MSQRGENQIWHLTSLVKIEHDEACKELFKGRRSKIIKIYYILRKRILVKDVTSNWLVTKLAVKLFMKTIFMYVVIHKVKFKL